VGTGSNTDRTRGSPFPVIIQRTGTFDIGTLQIANIQPNSSLVWPVDSLNIKKTRSGRRMTIYQINHLRVAAGYL
jgi:hypothetical protein